MVKGRLLLKLRRWLMYAGLVMPVFLLYGCPQLCQNSIDNGSAPMPAWLAGEWQLQTPDHNGAVYKLSPRPENAGQVLATVVNNSGVYEEKLIILSSIKHQVFVNIYDRGSDMVEAGWYIYKFQHRGRRKFSLLPLKEKIIPFTATAREIKTFLEKNINDPGIYNTQDIMVFRKKATAGK